MKNDRCTTSNRRPSPRPLLPKARSAAAGRPSRACLTPDAIHPRASAPPPRDEVDVPKEVEDLVHGEHAAADVDAAELLARQARLAVRDAATIQIVGMDRPVAINDIYQPTRIKRVRNGEVYRLEQLIERGRSAVVFGRPGAGKTVLLHYIFGQLTLTKGRVPALLRSGGPVSQMS